MRASWRASRRPLRSVARSSLRTIHAEMGS